MFYSYRQNNSGGYFEFNDEEGITIEVIVEANSVQQANALANSIGLYFDGVDSGIDCSCCGDRWSEPWREDDAEESLPTESYYDGLYEQDTAKGKTICIHYLNGEKCWL